MDPPLPTPTLVETVPDPDDHPLFNLPTAEELFPAALSSPTNSLPPPLLPLDRDDCSTTSTILSDVDDFDDDFRINAINCSLPPLLPSDDILVDDSSTSSDDSLYVSDADIFNLSCPSCKPTASDASTDPRFNAFLDNVAVSAVSVPIPSLSDLLAPESPPSNFTIQEVRHHDFDGVRAHLDDGAQMSTTHQKSHLHRYQDFPPDKPCKIRLIDAGGVQHIPQGFGFFHVPTAHGFLPAICFYTPGIPSVILSPSSIDRLLAGKRHSGSTLWKCAETGTFQYTAHSRLRTTDNIHFSGILDGGLCFTDPLLLPTDTPPSSSVTPATSADDRHLRSLWSTFHQLPSIESEFLIHRLNTHTERLLWHQRLCHASDEYVYNAHNHIDGIPKFSHQDPILDLCPTCIAAKLRKQPRSHDPSRKATVPWQGLGIDFAFTGQASKNTKRKDTYTGINGETCYILIADHHTSALDGVTRVSKGSPLLWLRKWLDTHSPDVDDKYVVLDQGGELYNNPKVRALFEEFHYAVHPTGTDSSHQNGPCERAHQSIGDALRSMLLGAHLDPRFWPHAFNHYIRVKNALPGKGNTPSAFERLHPGQRPSFSKLRTFGTRVWVRPPGRRSGRLQPHSCKGIFLGYLPNTLKNILWFDPLTKRIKIAYHARFDEGMNDLSSTDAPPNVQDLHRLRHDDPLPAELVELSAPSDFHFTTSPFTCEKDHKLSVTCDDPFFGFRIGTDAPSNRAYVTDILDHTTATKLCSSHRVSCRKFVGAFLTAINDVPIFSAADAEQELTNPRHLASPPTHLHLTLAPELLLSKSLRDADAREFDLYQAATTDLSSDDALRITPLELRAIHALRTAAPADSSCVTDDEIDLLIRVITSHAATPEELALGTLTRRKLKTLPTWPLWNAAEEKQCDQFQTLGMFGKPCTRPPDAIVLRPHWQYKIKTCGKRRSRLCCDGSPRAAPVLHALAESYSSCIEVPIFRLFCALTASLNYTIFAGDTQDAYAHSPGPPVPTFLSINDIFADWYLKKYGVTLDRSMVVPVRRALQGHPESGRLWEAHINGILTSPELGFRSTTHERNIYISHKFGPQPILLCRQVDDFAVACPDPSVAEQIFTTIGHKLRLPDETAPPFVNLGLATSFNGIDLAQTRDYVKVHCSSYIKRLLASHGWETPALHECKPGSRPAEPLPPSDIAAIYNTTGPIEHSSEADALQTEMGFSYRELLGELLYAYVTARPDIGYAITTLAKFAKQPARIHFLRLKNVAKYLRNTLDWGIQFWRTAPVASLPHVPLFQPDYPTTLPSFPRLLDPLQLTGYVDASHANDLRLRRSTTGYVFTLAGGAIAYRSKTQSITATSSTEAEFIAAVAAAKVAKYLRFILSQLGFPQHSPTTLYEDNESTIKMVNAGRPTERSRHIDIQFFAIQDWKRAGHIVLEHIAGVINPSDALTKSVGWILHSRHTRRIMGHFPPAYYPS